MNRSISTQELQIDGLGRRKPLRELSDKRITMAVRQVLRKQFGFDNVMVPCATLQRDGTWVGECLLDEVKFNYRVQPGL
jgi:hypothetical protein